MVVTATKGQASDWVPGELALLGQLQNTARGAKRGGLYALWLTVRVAMTLCRTPAPTERSRKRHVAGLERRLSSLSIPPPLRRALQASFEQLREGTPEAANIALRQLVAPAEDGVGPEAGRAVARAAEAARRAARAGKAKG
jgi:hypothetical protein